MKLFDGGIMIISIIVVSALLGGYTVHKIKGPTQVIENQTVIDIDMDDESDIDKLEDNLDGIRHKMFNWIKS